MIRLIRQGFTLVEVIIVIVIIGVLATIALPKVSGMIEGAKAGEAVYMLGVIKRAATQCFEDSNDLSHCGTFSGLGIDQPKSSLFLYTSDAATDRLRVVAHRNVNPPLDGGDICMEYHPAATLPNSTICFAVSSDGGPYKGIVEGIINSAKHGAITDTSMGWVTCKGWVPAITNPM